jgi:hypothetical protein
MHNRVVSTLPKFQRHACGVEGARLIVLGHPPPPESPQNKSWNFENLISYSFPLMSKTLKSRFSENYSAQRFFTVGLERHIYNNNNDNPPGGGRRGTGGYS